MTNPTERFSSRVENYIKYRPSYPAAVLDLLRDHHGLSPSSVIADLGSGTGILAELFLKNGNPVMGIEPNREMREAGERLLSAHPRFTSVDGTAEATTLPDASADFVTAGQAFHWFDRARTRPEMERILRPSGWVVLAWNDRRLASTSFLEAYERLLRTFGTDYVTVNHTNIDEGMIRAFFGRGELVMHVVENRQLFDLPGLTGRLLSSSYVPETGDARHAPMLAELAAIFHEHAQDGVVSFDYDTRLYCGRFA
ncbi:Methyltransferase [Minicystis rosea]|nr:Methyltransferase [Minicystis rosea]